MPKPVNPVLGLVPNDCPKVPVAPNGLLNVLAPRVLVPNVGAALPNVGAPNAGAAPKVLVPNEVFPKPEN